MLIEFSVSNYKSFRDRVTFSMIAANIKSPAPKLDESNTIKINDKLSLLTTAAIYGKNASGKSNFGKALSFMRNHVINSSAMSFFGDATDVTPFILSTSTRDKPSEFECVFLLDGKQYRYGFEVTAESIVSEWLFYVPNIREVALFERNEQNIRVKSAFKEGKGLEGRTRPDALFLSVVREFNGTTATAVIDWFLSCTMVSGLDDYYLYGRTRDFLHDKGYQDKIQQFVTGLDVDIDSLFVVMPAPPEHPVFGGPEYLQRHQQEELENTIFAMHQIFNEQGEAMESIGLNAVKYESEGTIKLIAIAGPIIDTLEKGRILFIDEFDARLHTEMTRAIVELFQSKETNPKGAQLIFVTHDTNLLDNTLLRRDQIWFAEKDKYGATSLTSLAEYNERNDANFESRYLGGRYGGVPSLDGLKDSVRDAQKAMEGAANA